MFVRAAFLCLGVALVSACQPTQNQTVVVSPVSSNSDTRALRAALEQHSTDLAVAGLMADVCGPFGIRRKVSDRKAVLAIMSAMGKSGYSPQQIEAAADRLSTPAGIRRAGNNAIAYLERRGVRPGGPPQALCAVAQDEIRRDSGIGRFLTQR